MTPARSDAAVAAPLAAPAAACEAPDSAPLADPAADVREFMVRAWSELLGRSDLTEHSDFFVRGGDSLLITRLVRRIGQEFGVRVPLYDMSRRNLGDQVALVHSARTDELPGGRGRAPADCPM
ncbi:acyl carrier protein [Streptomyces sp. NBC_01754]|uniref:acyl carrier protein n=1 Tax=Streptomyces sp. NBC_01754 TaxID=2975930 RepID=UPI002DD940FA|nr:acyl carrier protein [Streptomyces sp. NBC_01754]WSC90945.1 acyl carrier protein [Streptomyces sp. NBC_01754]WSC96561.1 acyl carrier protein [Streptomyces sp. NBC_01754]